MLYKPPDDLRDLYYDIQWLMWCGDEVYAQRLLINFADENIKDTSYGKKKEQEYSKSELHPQAQTSSDSVGGNDARE